VSAYVFLARSASLRPSLRRKECSSCALFGTTLQPLLACSRGQNAQVMPCYVWWCGRRDKGGENIRVELPDVTSHRKGCRDPSEFPRPRSRFRQRALTPAERPKFRLRLSVPFDKLRGSSDFAQHDKDGGFSFRGPEGPLFYQEFSPCKATSKSQGTLRHPGVSPGCLLFFPCRGDAIRRPARASARRDCTEKTLPLIPLMTLIFTDLNWAGRKLLFGNDTEGRDGFVKMAGFQFPHRTTSQLIRLAKVRYSGSFLSLFTKFERLRRHNFAHFTSSPLEKRVIRHELLDCRWTEADQRAV